MSFSIHKISRGHPTPECLCRSTLDQLGRRFSGSASPAAVAFFGVGPLRAVHVRYTVFCNQSTITVVLVDAKIW